MAAIGDFLRARRAAIDPESVGVMPYGRRRVPGLRREELAALAGVSADYYTRLEQGRVHPSADVLDAVARALGMDEPTRRHLHTLVRPARPRRRPVVVPHALRHALAAMDRTPAYVFGPGTQILAFNALAEQVIYPFSRLAPADRVMVELVFCDPLIRERRRDWEAMAAKHVALLRADVGRDPEDERLQALVGALTVASPEFARLWARHGVGEKTSGISRLRHPDVGDYDLDFDTLRLNQAPELGLVLMSAPPRSDGERALALLASLAAGDILQA